MSFITSTPRDASRTEARSHSSDCPPADFDPAEYPIIARHWYGIAPLHPIGKVAAQFVADRRRQRQFEHVTRLGSRAVGELVYEVAAGEDLDHALDAYERLTPDLLKALGGDRFPPVPIHEVPQ